VREEIGTDRADILAESRGWFHHDVPDEIAQEMMSGGTVGIARDGSRCGSPARTRASAVRAEMKSNAVAAVGFAVIDLPLDVTLASTFVARWCASQKVEIVDGLYRVRDDEPTSRIGAGLHKTP
jgi:hypothetical protein